jgi:hypothetical protein
MLRHPANRLRFIQISQHVRQCNAILEDFAFLFKGHTTVPQSRGAGVLPQIIFLNSTLPLVNFTAFSNKKTGSFYKVSELFRCLVKEKWKYGDKC